MKKAFLALSLLMVLLLSACASDSKQDTMYIRPSAFSEETKSVLSLFDDELAFFDCKIDDTISSYVIQLWGYTDGEWVERGEIIGESKILENQIGIRLLDQTYDLYEINESGHSKYTVSDLELGFDASIAVSSARLSESTAITTNTEIPLWVKLGRETDKIVVGESFDFRNADCNAGVAVTITFY